MTTLWLVLAAVCIYFVGVVSGVMVTACTDDEYEITDERS